MRISDWSSDVCSSDLLAVIPYDSEEEALEIANNSIYGLSAQVAAATNEEAYEFAKKILTCTVSINNGTWMAMDVPSGGFKDRGRGCECGSKGCVESLEIKGLGITAGERPTTHQLCEDSRCRGGDTLGGKS